MESFNPKDEGIRHPGNWIQLNSPREQFSEQNPDFFSPWINQLYSAKSGGNIFWLANV